MFGRSGVTFNTYLILCLARASQSSLLVELPRYRFGRISIGKSCWTWLCTSSHSDDEPEDRVSSQPEPEIRSDRNPISGRWGTCWAPASLHHSGYARRKSSKSPSRQTTCTLSCFSLLRSIPWTESGSLGGPSPYNTNIPRVRQWFILAFNSLHCTVDDNSIFPAANRLSIIVGMEKFTAERMCDTEYSFEPRQSINTVSLSSERNFARSHSFDTRSHSHSESIGILIVHCFLLFTRTFYHFEYPVASIPTCNLDNNECTQNLQKHTYLKKHKKTKLSALT